MFYLFIYSSAGIHLGFSKIRWWLDTDAWGESCTEFFLRSQSKQTWRTRRSAQANVFSPLGGIPTMTPSGHATRSHSHCNLNTNRIWVHVCSLLLSAKKRKSVTASTSLLLVASTAIFKADKLVPMQERTPITGTRANVRLPLFTTSRINFSVKLICNLDTHWTSRHE